MSNFSASTPVTRSLALTAAMIVNIALFGLLLAGFYGGSRPAVAASAAQSQIAQCGMLPEVVVHPDPQDLAVAPHQSVTVAAPSA